VRRCIFRGNQAQGGEATGGAIACTQALVEDCLFVDNGAGVSGFTNGYGGAVWCTAATLRRCEFRGNVAWGWEAARGGAVHSTSAVFEACTFEDNRALCPGGPRGGAVCDTGEPRLTGCSFRNNRAEAHYIVASGGAVEAGSGTVSGCWFAGNVARVDRGTGRGGGLVGDFVTIRDCVFVANEALQAAPLGPGEGGAVYIRFAADIEACTLVANAGGSPAGVGGLFLQEGGRVHRVLVASTRLGAACRGDATWTCSDLYGNAAGDALCGLDAGGNFRADPLFCSDPAASGDVSLRADSPCAPGNRPPAHGCERIGAAGVGCESQALEPATWTSVKQLYRGGAAPSD
jgi:predicted outer membrane repeat protein